MTTNISISQTLVQQTEILARQLNISPDQLVAIALERFINAHQTSQPTRKINQGDIYWVQLENGPASIPHPHVVIQDNVLNHSRIQMVVVCGLTTNLKRASLPGNVLLEAGEGNLAKPSVAEVSKISAVSKTQIGEYIGTLSARRIEEILAGMRFLQRSFFENQ